MTTFGTVQEAPMVEAGPGPRYRIVLVGIVAAVVGTVFGILLTIFTVIVPRKVELARHVGRASKIGDVQIQNIIGSVDPSLTPIGTIESRPFVYGYGGSPASTKSFEGTYQVPRARQQLIANQILGKLFADIQAKGAVSLFNVDSRTYGTKPDELNAYYSYDFFYPRGAGSLQIWAIGRGDDLTICVSLSER